jgi:hypothetical protein
VKVLQNVILEYNSDSDQRENLRKIIGPIFECNISEAKTIGYSPALD